MSTAKKPVAMQPGLAYIHVTSAQPPSTITSALSAHSQYHLEYLGPVGELEGEHIFQVQRPDGGVVPRSELPEDVLSAIKTVQGVKGAKVLETKQRAKRDEF
ncbi:hypothetical protein DB88DRAFT_375357 [Papiliotrema laurentii]|jgi:hypothetical protein|uniref:Uncharacterized protein n=1 Tax=Papiliotrema laurentii TaxID=5418 RepID=A0AAD9FJV1_PAPLA|nr:hypothetical protein DB88DRAFT_375357 [Papiliotrema laurentii]